MPNFCRILICLIGVFCICESKKNKNFLVVYKCPYSIKPIVFEDFVKKAADKKNNKYWKDCLLPDYSCAKIRISGEKHIFTCLSDYGSIAPAFFKKVNGSYQVGQEEGVLLKKGCEFLTNSNITDRTHSTVTYQGRTFVTELVCCKGDICNGRNWKTIWGDGEVREKMEFFWYTSISISATLFSLIATKISLIAYHRLKERLVINALKTISTTLAEADEEDKSKRRTAILRMFRIFKCRRKKKKKRNLGSTSSERTNSVEVLLKEE